MNLRALLVIVLLLGSGATAAEPGRLFFTPEERAAMEKDSPPAETTPLPASPPADAAADRIEPPAVAAAYGRLQRGQGEAIWWTQRQRRPASPSPAPENLLRGGVLTRRPPAP